MALRCASGGRPTGFDLLLEGRHSHHEVFVQVGAKNRQELQRFQQGSALIQGFVEHPPIEL